VAIDLKPIVEHDGTEECVACRAQALAMQALVPAVAAWEDANELPRFSIALHGATELLGTMLREGIDRAEIEDALATLLDDLEAQLAEDKAMGGPPQGTA